MPNFRRYDFENPPDDPDDLPSDWSSSQSDAPFDAYEDYVMETGNDPYHVFDEPNEPQGVFWLKMRLRGLWAQIRHVWNWYTSAKYRQHYDDIPF